VDGVVRSCFRQFSWWKAIPPVQAAIRLLPPNHPAIRGNSRKIAVNAILNPKKRKRGRGGLGEALLDLRFTSGIFSKP